MGIIYLMTGKFENQLEICQKEDNDCSSDESNSDFQPPVEKNAHKDLTKIDKKKFECEYKCGKRFKTEQGAKDHA